MIGVSDLACHSTPDSLWTPLWRTTWFVDVFTFQPITALEGSLRLTLMLIGSHHYVALCSFVHRLTVADFSQTIACCCGKVAAANQERNVCAPPCGE